MIQISILLPKMTNLTQLSISDEMLTNFLTKIARKKYVNIEHSWDSDKCCSKSFRKTTRSSKNNTKFVTPRTKLFQSGISKPNTKALLQFLVSVTSHRKQPLLCSIQLPQKKFSLPPTKGAFSQCTGCLPWWFWAASGWYFETVVTQYSWV